MIAAVVLAAGSSTRMGRPKLLLPLGSKSLVRRVVEEVLASRIDRVLVVTGPDGEKLVATLAPLPIEPVDNPDHRNGLSTSVRAGLGALGADAEAAVMVLADQPFVDRTVFDGLIETYRSSGAAIVQPRYAGQPGNPILWDRSTFGELMAQEGDQGGRTLLRRWSERVVQRDFPDPVMAADVDTPDAYEAARSSAVHRGGLER
jgi:molybdenum cofactor cytidylyltransferase